MGPFIRPLSFIAFYGLPFLIQVMGPINLFILSFHYYFHLYIIKAVHYFNQNTTRVKLKLFFKVSRVERSRLLFRYYI